MTKEELQLANNIISTVLTYAHFDSQGCRENILALIKGAYVRLTEDQRLPSTTGYIQRNLAQSNTGGEINELL